MCVTRVHVGNDYDEISFDDNVRRRIDKSINLRRYVMRCV